VSTAARALTQNSHNNGALLASLLVSTAARALTQLSQQRLSAGFRFIAKRIPETQQHADWQKKVAVRKEARPSLLRICPPHNHLQCVPFHTVFLSQHCTSQHSTAQHSTAQHSIAQHSTAQHSTAQHSTAQYSTAQHSTAQQSIILSSLTHLCSLLLLPQEEKVKQAELQEIADREAEKEKAAKAAAKNPGPKKKTKKKK
jgi:hypothetical protein